MVPFSVIMVVYFSITIYIRLACVKKGRHDLLLVFPVKAKESSLNLFTRLCYLTTLLIKIILDDSSNWVISWFAPIIIH